MDLTKICCEGVSWIELTQERVQMWEFLMTVINLQVLQNQ